MYFLGTFETNSTAQFTSASGSVQSSVVKEDTYAGLNENNENFLKNINTDYGLSDIAKTYAGAWFRWTGTIDNGWYVMLGDGAGSNQWALYTLTGSKLKIVINGVTYNGTTVLSANTWYFIMVEFYCHDSAGYAKVYINGTLDINTGTIDSKTGTDTGVRQIKWQGTNSAGGVNTYVDNCLFSSYDPDFGIKVSKSGKSVLSMDLKNQDFNSNNFFLKFHDQQDTSVTFNPTDTEKSATISHSLGYVPAFRAFFDYDGKTYMIPSIPVSVGFDQWAYAYATNTGITVGFKMSIPYNQLEFTGSNGDINEDLWTGSEGLIVGNVSGSGYSSAIRFSGVTVAQGQSLYSANVEVLNVFSGPSSSDTKYKIWGIDEDDIGSGFSSGSTKTTAYDARNQAKVSGFWNFGTDVKDQVDEILGRAGWSSGNHMGFIFENDSSPENAYIGDTSNSTIKLTIVKSGTLTIPFRVIIFKDKIAT